MNNKATAKLPKETLSRLLAKRILIDTVLVMSRILQDKKIEKKLNESGYSINNKELTKIIKDIDKQGLPKKRTFMNGLFSTLCLFMSHDYKFYNRISEGYSIGEYIVDTYKCSRCGKVMNNEYRTT